MKTDANAAPVIRSITVRGAGFERTLRDGDSMYMDVDFACTAVIVSADFDERLDGNVYGHAAAPGA